MVVNMYIISPKKDWFKLVFFSLFDFSKMKRPRPRLQKTKKRVWSWSCLLLVQFRCSLLPVLGLDFQTLMLCMNCRQCRSNPELWYMRTKVLELVEGLMTMQGWPNPWLAISGDHTCTIISGVSPGTNPYPCLSLPCLPPDLILITTIH